MIAGYYDNAGIYHPPDEPDPSTDPGVITAPPAVTPPTFGPFTERFSAPAMRGLPSLPNVPGAPTPNLPTYQKPPEFRSPSVSEALADPSYTWRRDQGGLGLQRWAASRGTLNDSGTANALTDYYGNAASQEYQNIWNRAYAGYQANVQSQYLDPYKFAYQRELDLNDPAIQTWRAGVDMSRLGYVTEAGYNQAQDQADYRNAFEAYQDRYRQWLDDRDARLAFA